MRMWYERGKGEGFLQPAKESATSPLLLLGPPQRLPAANLAKFFEWLLAHLCCGLIRCRHLPGQLSYASGGKQRSDAGPSLDFGRCPLPMVCVIWSTFVAIIEPTIKSLIDPAPMSKARHDRGCCLLGAPSKHLSSVADEVGHGWPTKKKRSPDTIRHLPGICLVLQMKLDTEGQRNKREALTLQETFCSHTTAGRIRFLASRI